MSVIIAYVGGTMNTERETVRVAPGYITIPASPGLPEEFYRRLSEPDDVPVVYGSVSTPTKEGSPA